MEGLDGAAPASPHGRSSQILRRVYEARVPRVTDTSAFKIGETGFLICAGAGPARTQPLGRARAFSGGVGGVSSRDAYVHKGRTSPPERAVASIEARSGHLGAHTPLVCSSERGGRSPEVDLVIQNELFVP